MIKTKVILLKGFILKSVGSQIPSLDLDSESERVESELKYCHCYKWA